MKKIGILFLISVVFILSYFYSKIDQFIKNITSNNKNQTNQQIVEKKEIFNYALLGFGGISPEGIIHDGTYLTDTIIVANIDLKQKKINLISVPRDLWVKVPTKSGEDFHLKINSIYQNELFPDTFPDIKQTKNLTKEVLKEVTGLEIDSFITVDFYGFTKFIDILGGVDVQVEKTFDDTQYPIDGKEKDQCGKTDDEFQKLLPELEATDSPELVLPCRYETLHFNKGLVHMTGVEALKYARSRHSKEDGGDFGRAARQQKVIEAVKDKILSIGFIPKIVPLLDEMQKHIKTDITKDEINKLSKEAYSIKSYKIEKIVISDQNWLKDGYSENGQWILIPRLGIDNFLEIKKEVNNSLLGITPTPTLTASQSAKIKKQ